MLKTEPTELGDFPALCYSTIATIEAFSQGAAPNVVGAAA